MIESSSRSYIENLHTNVSYVYAVVGVVFMEFTTGAKLSFTVTVVLV